jgi:excinuclease UvrABC ATPase subunit
MDGSIVLNGARLHSPTSVTLAVPKGRLVVLIGIPGSGRSTLVPRGRCTRG